jgi:hypothetical protein
MTSLLKRRWPVVATLLGTLALAGFLTAPYGWNVSAPIHTDERMHGLHPLPAGFVVLQVPSYDGSQYYQIARDFPKLFSLEGWQELRSRAPLSYAYQRILLPATVFVLSLGQVPLFPYVFLLLNIVALSAAAYIMLRWEKGTPLAALAVAFCPSAMVALHFTLAEPLALLLIVLFLVRYSRNERIGWLDVLLLSLLVLSREVNILFAGFVLLYTLYKRQWKDSGMMLIPLAVFGAHHGLLYAIFGDVPFLTSAGARQLPFSAPMKVLLGLRGYDSHTLSSVALFLGFTLPAFVWSGIRLLRGTRTFATIGLFVFLCVMVTLSDAMWGSITSVGRVITPIYPLAVIAFTQANTRTGKVLTLAILLIGLGAALGLAAIHHPYVIV